MPLPTVSLPLTSVAFDAEQTPAFLVRFPEAIWEQLGNAASQHGPMSVIVSEDGAFTLDISGQSIPLHATPTGQTTDIYSVAERDDDAGPSLVPIGVAHTRLSIPMSSVNTTLAADKLQKQNAALDRERKERAERVASGKATIATLSGSSKNTLPPKHKALGIATAAPMARVQSGPAAGPSFVGQTTPAIPLKTRVVQLLALGPATLAEVVNRVGGLESEVSRVVNVVARASSEIPPSYTLVPAQYAKIKIGAWKYTHIEKVTVIQLARQAFDELGLPPDAEEREELDKKEHEALNGDSRSSSSSREGAQLSQLSHSIPARSPSPTAPRRKKSPDEIESIPRDGRSTKEKSGASEKVERTKVGKQIAKFRAEHVKRASSLPVVKNVDGTTNPKPPSSAAGVVSTSNGEKVDKEERLSSSSWVREMPSGLKDKEKTVSSASNGKRKEKSKTNEKSRSGGHTSRDYTSSENSDSEANRPLRGRAPDSIKTIAPPLVESNGGKRKLEDMGKIAKLPPAKTRRRSRDYTSSESDYEDTAASRGRAREVKKKMSSSLPNGKGSTSRRGSDPPEFVKQPPPRKSSPARHHKPPPLDLARGRTNGDSSVLLEPSALSLRSVPSNSSKTPSPPEKPDAERMRDRYEELFPAYEQMTVRLATLHQAAERVHESMVSMSGEEGEIVEYMAPGADEVQKMVKKWEKWHRELEAIRAWFAEP